jgi:hypothetical protein
MPTILFRKRTAAPAAPPASGGATRAGEPFWNLQGFTGGGPNSLWVDNGTTLVPLVDSSRQVELAGAQTITGAKTFSLTSFLLTGSPAAGQVLSSTGPGGGVAWVPPAQGGTTYTFNIGLTETGGTVDLLPALPAVIGGVSIAPTSGLTNTAGAIAVAPAQAAQLGGVMVPARGAAQGLLLAGNGQLTLPAADAALLGGVTVPARTAAQGLQLAAGVLTLPAGDATLLGGVTVPAGTALTVTGGALGMSVATPADATAGTNNTLPITSSVLQLGAPPGTGLTTNARTLVPAINELKSAVDALTGNLIFGGLYNASTNVLTPTQAPGNPFGNAPIQLPAATAAMVGYYLIVNQPGTVTTPPPPTGSYAQGDWLVVEPSPAWVHITLGVTAVEVDGVSIIGDGLTPLTALEVGVVDGGVY